MSDEELQAGFLKELRSEPAVRQSRIYVRSRDGTVTLSGQVASLSQKQKLDAAVLRVAGLKALDMQVSIRRFAVVTETEEKSVSAHPVSVSNVPTQAASAAIVKTAGLRDDAPRDVVNAIIKALDTQDGLDVKEVKSALSNFNLPTLLRPGATVHSLATGLSNLENSDIWPSLVRQCP